MDIFLLAKYAAALLQVGSLLEKIGNKIPAVEKFTSKVTSNIESKIEEIKEKIESKK